MVNFFIKIFVSKIFAKNLDTTKEFIVHFTLITLPLSRINPGFKIYLKCMFSCEVVKSIECKGKEHMRRKRGLWCQSCVYGTNFQEKGWSVFQRNSYQELRKSSKMKIWSILINVFIRLSLICFYISKFPFNF